MESLSDKEKEILESLAKNGTMTPSEISVKTYILPDEVEGSLKTLREKGLISSLSIAEKPQSIEKEACTLTPKGRKALKS